MQSRLELSQNVANILLVKLSSGARGKKSRLRSEILELVVDQRRRPIKTYKTMYAIDARILVIAPIEM